ncbi:phage tail sheath subtilisin-like domain-containing protein [Acidocella sp.]|uniref:phage tail sheath subtilisin-like domain-containing protein n=1 Tax=Acidocella sp. TaxID=50710 RepID=UPI0026162583|nr:phage tail sheath subtilisin-like domain-containing protein [Acidocella sp.]MDD2794363.1 phage tail sheath subtilisin-like domain-containing protein [Acidocella sp.]
MSQSVGVPFQNIPAGFIPPLFYVEFNNQLAGVQGNTQQPALLIGQMQASGTATAGVPVYIASQSAAMNLFGKNSQLARMCATYFNSDPVGPLYALPLADAAGSAAATGTFTITGPATAAGTFYAAVGRFTVPVGVSVGDTATVIAANIAAAINALVLIPVTAAAVAGVVTFTAVNKGLQGNNINLAINPLGPVAGQVLPAGVGVTIAAMAGGATDADLGTVAASIGDQQFDFIGHPYGETAQMGEMTTAMNDTTGRWAWNRQDYGHVWTATPGTISSLLTYGGTLNDQHADCLGIIGYLADPVDFVADWMGAAAVSLRNLPSQPLQSLKLSTVTAAPRANWLTLAQENTLYAAGIALPRSDSYGNVTVGQDVTTYKTNAFGQPDASYRYPTTLFTLMAITRQIKSALVTKFGRSLLVPDGTRAGQNVPVVSPVVALAEIIAQYHIMEANGLVVNAAAMAQATTVAINATNPNRLDIVWRPELANGLSMMAMINQFILNPAQAV